MDTRELELHALRRSIGIIFQETFLFSATVSENIAYGRPEARTRGNRGRRAGGAGSRVHRRAREGYDTVIGERGISLSGGQKQRLSDRARLLDESAHSDSR